MAKVIRIKAKDLFEGERLFEPKARLAKVIKINAKDLFKGEGLFEPKAKEDEPTDEDLTNFLNFLSCMAENNNEEENDECESSHEDDSCDCHDCYEDYCDCYDDYYDDEEYEEDYCSEDEETCESKEEIDAMLSDFLSSILGNKDNKESENKGVKEYTFTEMIEEFTNGYNGLFTDGQLTYDFRDGTLLCKTEVGVFPVSLTLELLNSKYYKSEVRIDNSKALELAINGETPKFVLELGGNTYKGHLTMKNGLPSCKVSGDNVVSHEIIVLRALMTGKWFL